MIQTPYTDEHLVADYKFMLLFSSVWNDDPNINALVLKCFNET